MNTLIKRCFVMVALIMITGCGATDFQSKMPDSFQLRQGQTIEFPPIENSTGKALDPPADQIFNEYMAQLLRERQLLHTAATQPPTLILKTKLIEYEAGNAAARWVLPGLGTTICTVHAELLDKSNGALQGRMQARQTVSFGGAYSIGADTYICKRAADDLIKEIDKNMEKKSAG